MFAYTVKDPERYGVVEFGRDGRAVDIEEKPKAPKSSMGGDRPVFLRQPGASISPPSLKPSARGELEITDVNRAYLEPGPLHVERLGRGVAWLDTGTYEALLHAANFVQSIEERQGLMMACLEEIAYRMGYISADELRRLARDECPAATAAIFWMFSNKMPFSFEPLAIPDVLLIAPRVFNDTRGFFMETYKRSEFAAAGINEIFVQENHSASDTRGPCAAFTFSGRRMRRASSSGWSAGRSSMSPSIFARTPRPADSGSASSSRQADRKLLYHSLLVRSRLCVLSDRAEVVYLDLSRVRARSRVGHHVERPCAGH